MDNRNCFLTFFNSIYEILINSKKPKVSKYDKYFHNEKSTNWTYKEFVNNFFDNLARMEPEKSTVLCAFIYLDRILNANRKLLKRQNLLRLITISIILSHKYNEDIVFTDKCYCEVLGIDMNMFLSLEIIFCEMINYRFYVSDKTFLSYNNCLIALK